MLHLLECFYDELEEDMTDQVMNPRKCEVPHSGVGEIKVAHTYIRMYVCRWIEVEGGDSHW